jgi:tRNA U55 pseudouridine synthase TruB
VEGFNSEEMLTLEQLQELAAQKGVSALDEYVLPMDKTLAHYPSIALSEWWLALLRCGKSFICPELSSGLKRLYAQDGQFKGLVMVDDSGRVKAERLLAF